MNAPVYQNLIQAEKERASAERLESLATLAAGAGHELAAPLSTIDPDCLSGDQIPIEQRPADELLAVGERRHAADGVAVWNPVFDVTPAALVDALVTDTGVVERPDTAKIRALLDGASG